MTRESDKFERQIERIHHLIEKSDADVTWNEKVPDPDNPEQERQIDITIKSNNSLTIVECRIHKRTQDVKWIEELMGKRISLRADNVIAVSSSGFTKGAKEKAKKHGIILRDLINLVDEEVQNWGKSAKVRISFFHLEDVSIGFLFKSAEVYAKVQSEDIVKATQKSRGLVRSILEKVCFEVDSKKPKYPVKGKFLIEIPNAIIINGLDTKFVEVSAKLSISERELLTPLVRAYDNPDQKSSQRKIFVESKDLGDTEVIQSGDNVSMLLDLSAIGCEPNRILKDWNFEFQQIVNFKKAHFVIDKHFFDTALTANFGLRYEPNPESLKNTPPYN